MRALVTGGTGFIGNRLVLHLARNGWEVTCLVRRPVVSRVEQVDYAVALKSPPPNVDCVFHLAATIFDPRWLPADYVTANGGGTSTMLELAEACKARGFVYTSTQLVIGKPARAPFGTDHPTRPESPYAVSKLKGEEACEAFRSSGRVATTSLRLTSVVGLGMARGAVLPMFAERALRGEDLTYHGSGSRVQNFVHVDDVVRACVLAAEHPGNGVLNIGGVDSLSMKELAEAVVCATPASISHVRTSGKDDPQEDYRWIPELDGAHEAIGYAPCVRMNVFLPQYIKSIAKPVPVARWWDEA
jgi:nucleoside-diphosphate-sugar epimerase